MKVKLKRPGRSTTFGILAVAVLVVLAAVLAMGVNRKVEHSASAPVSKANSAQPTYVPEPEPKRVVLIGDFTAESAEGGSGPRNWTALVGLALQTNSPTRVTRDNSEGSGYVAPGAFNQTFMDAAKVLVRKDTNAVVVFGSRYDMYAAPDAVKSAAGQTYDFVRKTAPDAALIVVGPAWPGSSPPPELLATRDVVRDAASEANAVFVDPIEEGWFADDPGKYVGKDNVHPSDAGHERIAIGIYLAVLKALTPKS